MSTLSLSAWEVSTAGVAGVSMQDVRLYRRVLTREEIERWPGVR